MKKPLKITKTKKPQHIINISCTVQHLFTIMYNSKIYHTVICWELSSQTLSTILYKYLGVITHTIHITHIIKIHISRIKLVTSWYQSRKNLYVTCVRRKKGNSVDQRQQKLAFRCVVALVTVAMFPSPLSLGLQGWGRPWLTAELEHLRLAVTLVHSVLGFSTSFPLKKMPKPGHKVSQTRVKLSVIESWKFKCQMFLAVNLVPEMEVRPISLVVGSTPSDAETPQILQEEEKVVSPKAHVTGAKSHQKPFTLTFTLFLLPKPESISHTQTPIFINTLPLLRNHASETPPGRGTPRSNRLRVRDRWSFRKWL